MAQLNEILEGSLNQALTRRLGMTGGAPAPTLMPEMTPALVLENDRPEWGWLKREILMMGNYAAGPTAAQLSWVALNNPVGSNALVVIEAIETQTAVGTDHFRILTQAGFNGVTVPRDTREAAPQGTGFNGSATVTGGTTPGAPAILKLRQWPVSGNFTFSNPIVLAPGTGYMVIATTVNILLTVNWIFRERRALSSELG